MIAFAKSCTVGSLIVISICAFAQLPNPKLTPGAIRTTDAKAICSASFTTRDERHTTAAMKRQVCQAYGIKDCPKAKVVEIDHACPLELGGADEIGNLWVQLAKYKDGSPGYHQKDALENKLHKLVCSGKMTLKDAQSCILTNWIACYKKVMTP